MSYRAAILLFQGDKIALIERHRSGMHYFTFPGGHVEEGETPEQTAVREAEETFRLGVPAVILFGIPKKKDPRGSEAYARSGIIQQAIRAIKDKLPELVVITDEVLHEGKVPSPALYLKRLTRALSIIIVAAGTVVTLSAGRAMEGLLYGTGRSDPACLVATAIVLLGTAAAAGVVPAWRAGALDPARVLREE